MSSSQVNLDDLCRDPNDGAYHCPSCETPFTRRSNLRRHFVIHTRNLPFKCPNCEERFSRGDELHYHSLLCNETSWRDTTDFFFQSAFNRPEGFDAMLTDHSESPIRAQSLLPQNSLASSPSNQSSPDKDQALEDLLSSFATTAMPDMQQHGLPYDQFSTLEELTAFSSVGSGILSPSRSRCSSANRVAPYPRRVQQYNGGHRSRKSKEKPIYTRRQVDDMLDAVSTCFAGTMEEVLRRVDSQSKPPEKQLESTRRTTTQASPSSELRKMLSETLPRLFDSLQSVLEDKNRVE
ncbi:hypothetical protein D9615_006930 [Tricholomella constricta]|uniref:C2H2-type domain-containing protein n=1 Tax=Tricholomella constricta TaxID=117010 RepID=A0A8H5H8Q1_9AGAR|nr:hypothetical protein D9615_006930 [Tricholomella constricta]